MVVFLEVNFFTLQIVHVLNKIMMCYNKTGTIFGIGMLNFLRILDFYGKYEVGWCIAHIQILNKPKY